MRSPLDVIEEQMRIIETMPKVEMYQSMVTSHKVYGEILKVSRISENIFAPITGIEILPCEGLPDDNMITFNKKTDARYFIETVKQFGWPKAKGLYKL